MAKKQRISKPKNCAEMLEQLCNVVHGISTGEMTLEEAAEINKTAGEINKVLMSKLKQAKQRKEKPEIPFFDN